MKRHAWKYFLAFAVLAAGCAGLTSYQLKLKPYQLEGADFPLPSGLRIFFQEDKGQPSVIVTSVVGAGSTSEPPGKEGMAHLIEHLNFRARHSNQPKVWDMLKMMGASFNAFTEHDKTTYYTIVPKDSLPALLDIEAKRMLDPLEGVTDEIINVEREVVRNELRQSDENNLLFSAGLDVVFEMLFPVGHPYHRSIIGSHETLKSITLDDVKAYTKKYYRPDNVTIVVAGDFDRKEVGKILGRAFPRELLAAPGYQGKDLPVGTPQVRIKGPGAEPPAPSDRSIRHIKGPLERPTVVLGWSLPAAYRENEPLMRAVVANMTQAVGSLLYPEDLFESERVNFIACFFEPGTVHSAAICAIALLGDDKPEEIAKKAVDGLWEQWDQATRGWRRSSIGMATTYAMVDLFNLSGSLERATDIATYLHYTGQPDFFTRNIAGLAKVKEFDAREFAFKYLNRERVVKLVVEPYSDEEQKAGVQRETTGKWSGELREENKELTAAFAALPADKIAKVAIAPNMATVREFDLANGLRVVIKRHGQTPFVGVAAMTYGGRYDSSPPHMADLTYVEDDAREPMLVAGRWFRSTGDTNEFGEVQAPSGNLFEALDIVATSVSTIRSTHEPIVYDADLKKYKARQKETERYAAYWASKAIDEAIFAGHPLARADPDFARLERLGKADYSAWLDRTIAPKNMVLLVAGDINPDETEKLVRERFGSWRVKNPGSELPPLPPLPPPPAQQVLLFDDPALSQAEIGIGCQAVPATVGNDAARRVALGVLNENLWITIRESTGASYGVYAGGRVYRGGAGRIDIGGMVQLDKAPPLLNAVLGMLRDYHDGKIDPAAVNQAKWNLARTTHTQNLGYDEMLSTLAGQASLGFPIMALGGYPQRLAKVTPADVAAQFALCAGHEVVTVVGPAKTLAEPLKALGLPVTVVDWNKHLAK